MRLLLIISLFHVGLLVGQENPILNYFSANLLDDQVYLSLEIKGGSQCNGITVLRSVDSVNFDEIGTIPGICGSPDFAQAYEFTDSYPVANAHNYYKVELGSQGFSSVAGVHYVELYSEGYKVFPNPIAHNSQLFLKDRDESYDIVFFSLQGKKIASISMAQTSSSLELGQFNFHSGTVVFNATSENGSVVTGKFLVP